MDTNYNPMIAALQGQQVGESLANAQAQGMSWRERLALKKAAGAMGSQNYFTGYEGVPGAERPDYLKEAWAGSDPAEAAKLEAMVSEPFKLQRGVRIAGETEFAKKTADATAMFNFEQQQDASERAQLAMDGQGGQPNVNAMTGVLETPSAVRGRSGTERTRGFGPGGYTNMRKTLSPFEMEMKAGEHDARKAATQQARDTDNEKNYQNLISNKKNAQDGLRQAVAAQSTDPGASEVVALAHQALRDSTRALDQYMKKMGPSAMTSAAPAPTIPAASQEPELTGYDPQGELGRPSPAAPAVMPSPRLPAPASPTTGLSRDKQQDVSQTALNEKRTIANKAIEAAHAGAMKSKMHAPGIEELLRLTTSQNLGNRVIGNLPMGETAMRMYSEDNNRLVTLRNQMIDVFKEEGQTKAFDTLPELKIVASMIPDLSAGPDTNRMSMAALGNLMESRAQAADFLEQWAAQHGGTIDGARTKLRDWMQASPRYLTPESSGNVKITKNPKYVPLSQWAGATKKTPAPPDGMTPTVPAFHDPEKQKRYERFKQTHTP